MDDAGASHTAAIRAQPSSQTVREAAPSTVVGERLCSLFMALVPAASAELRRALQFSIALYEHADLSSFPLDRTHAEEDVEVLVPGGW